MIKTFRFPILAALGSVALLSGCSAIQPTEMAYAKPSWTSKCEDLTDYQQRNCYQVELDDLSAPEEGGE